MKIATREDLIKSLKEIGLGEDITIKKALDLSESIHRDQIRDSGNNYLEEHIYPVTIGLLSRHKNHPDIKKLITVALLHDAVEDGNLEEGYLTNEFDAEIEKYVIGVTKKKVVLTERPTQEWLYNQMAENIKQVENAGEISQIVKMEDRIQNTESMVVTPSKREKYIRMLQEIRDLFIPLALRMNNKYNYPEILEREAKRVEDDLI